MKDPDPKFLSITTTVQISSNVAPKVHDEHSTPTDYQKTTWSESANCGTMHSRIILQHMKI